MNKEYRMVMTSIRNSIDLREFESIIKEAYRIVNPTLKVTVFSSYYEVCGNLTRGQAIEAGRIIAQSSLGRYAVKYPIHSENPSTVQIFRGKEV